MKKIFFLTLLLIAGTVTLSAQNEKVLSTIAVFPYQHKSEAASAISTMQLWKQSNWNTLLSMLDDDSLRLKASYALNAYVNQSSIEKEMKMLAAGRLVKGLPSVHSYYGRELVIKYLGLLGEDIAVKPLSKLLSDQTYADNAARALATIHTEKAVAALNKGLAKGNTDGQKQIQAALDYLNNPVPELKEEGFTILFDGSNMNQWTGNTAGYLLENGQIVVHPEMGGGGNLYTKEEYADFDFRFEFQLTPGANNGLGIRAPLTGDAAYVGMELQILDNEADKYKNLHPYQYHGSVYGVIPAKRGFLLPTGEWNHEQVIAKGSRIKVILNGETILDGDIKNASRNGTMDHKEHPGLLRPGGHIGFLGHGDVVRFRNIRVKRL